MHERAEERLRERPDVARVVRADRRGDLLRGRPRERVTRCRGGVRGRHEAGRPVARADARIDRHGGDEPQLRRRGQPLAQRRVGRVEALHVPDLDDAAGACRELDDPPGVGPRQAQGLLHEDVRAGVERVERDRRVRAVGRATRTASTPACSSRSSCAAYAAAMPCRRATASRTRGLGSATATTAKRPLCAARAGRCASWVINPQPTTPRRTCFPVTAVGTKRLDHWLTDPVHTRISPPCHATYSAGRRSTCISALFSDRSLAGPTRTRVLQSSYVSFASLGAAGSRRRHRRRPHAAETRGCRRRPRSRSGSG